MKTTIFSYLLFLISLSTFGTAQIPDILIYNGDTLDLFSCPLAQFPNKEINNPKTLFGSKGCFYTACWRNYVATWEIIDNKLYLIKIRNACYPTNLKYVSGSYRGKSDTIGSEYADLKTLFPDRFKNGKVYADWLNGNIISPIGKLMFYVHDGFLSVFEKEIEFTFINGVLINHQVLDNSQTKVSKYTQDQNLLLKYISDNIDYSKVPEPTEKIRVLIKVLRITDDGKIDSLSIMKGYDLLYDQEAIRVVKSIPEWDVLYRHGKRFDQIWVIPVTFQKK